MKTFLHVYAADNARNVLMVEKSESGHSGESVELCNLSVEYEGAQEDPAETVKMMHLADLLVESLEREEAYGIDSTIDAIVDAKQSEEIRRIAQATKTTFDTALFRIITDGLAAQRQLVGV